jgi:hypothetical protein
MLSNLPGAATAIVAMAVLSAGLPPMAAQTPAPPSLQEQLEAQYQVSKMDNANACALTATGTALRIQKPGVFAVPASNLITCPAKYEDGKVGGPNPLCRAMVKQNASTFRAGHRVYVLKIDANPKKEKISFAIVSCSDQGASWKGEVVFQFPKDYLEKASVTEVEDKISELLALDDDNAQQAQAPGAPPGSDQAQPQPGDPGQQQQPQVTIQIGQPLRDVEAALGPPEKRVDLGAKQIYVYKDLKITFVDGKVSDVQ